MADPARGPVAQGEVKRRFSWLFFVLEILTVILTAPYRRTFKMYTWQPLQEIRAAEKDHRILIPLARDFKSGKYAELQSVQVAASFCTGATLATLPWSRSQHVIWVADALWFASLSFAIWAVITSIQTKSILDDLPNHDQLNSTLPEPEVQRMRRTVLRYRKTPGVSHWIMLFIWQFPSMTMSYAWTTFIAGLTVYMCNPFIQHAPWGFRHKIAIVYLVVGSLGLSTYILTSVFVLVSEKDLARSRASTRVNSNVNPAEAESQISTAATVQADTRRQRGPSDAEEHDLVQALRAKTLGDTRREPQRSATSKRQLLI